MKTMIKRTIYVSSALAMLVLATQNLIAMVDPLDHPETTANIDAKKKFEQFKSELKGKTANELKKTMSDSLDKYVEAINAAERECSMIIYIYNSNPGMFTSIIDNASKEVVRGIISNTDLPSSSSSKVSPSYLLGHSDAIASMRSHWDPAKMYKSLQPRRAETIEGFDAAEYQKGWKVFTGE